MIHTYILKYVKNIKTVFITLPNIFYILVCFHLASHACPTTADTPVLSDQTEKDFQKIYKCFHLVRKNISQTAFANLGFRKKLNSWILFRSP